LEFIVWLVPAMVAFLLAVLLASFVEYWGHRLMHQNVLLKKRHARHHKLGSGQSWFGEFLDYVTPSLLLMWVGFLHSTAAGIGFVAGAVIYAAVAAWAHQLQHEAPTRVFWMKQPVHTVHHVHQEWHHNFGITVDLWDRVFGTFRHHEETPEIEGLGADLGLLQIHWFSRSDPLPVHKRKRPVS
jgi:sterol desaturase/sphingolipid hydroxylase (fatty acid hydroxylase superfamily)